MSKDNWGTFHFESNQALGLCENKAQWLEIKKKYLKYWEKNGGIDLEKAMSRSYGCVIPHFGFRAKYTSNYSLAQFARDNGMVL